MKAKKTIAVVGAGPSGMSVLQAFKNHFDEFEVVVFDRQSATLGLWNLDCYVGVDKFGEVVHGSMYHYLDTNGPKESLEFPDFTFEECFGQELGSFPPRAIMERYLRKRYDSEENLKRVRLETAVRHIRWLDDEKKFEVTATNLREKKDTREKYDYVFNCAGHYNRPNMIFWPGFDKYGGRLMHSHDFRDAAQFKGQTIMTIGSSYSAEDVAMQSVKYGASKAFLCARETSIDGHPWDAYKWPTTGPHANKFVKKPILTKVEGKTVHFKDGSTEEVDVIIVCTGFRHHYPWLEESLRLQESDLIVNNNMYQNIFWQDRPELMYIGAQSQWYTFTYFEMQAIYARDVLLNKIPLPSAEDRAKHQLVWRNKEDSITQCIGSLDLQAEYMLHIGKEIDYNGIDVEKFVKGALHEFHDWEHNKIHDIMTFRDQAHRCIVNGKMSPKMKNGTWMERMSEDPDLYLKNVDIPANQ